MYSTSFLYRLRPLPPVFTDFLAQQYSKEKINHRKMSTKSTDNRVLTVDTINPNVITMEYAVRGPIVIRAVELEKQLENGAKLPFNSVIKANIGDAHAMGQTPITFIRQVIACTSDPSLLKIEYYPEDVKQKALSLLNACGGGSVGSYTQSNGIEIIRKHIAQFIERRDGYACDPDSVCISGGASESIRNVLKLFIHPDSSKKKSGIMVPIPQYPLYSASIEEFNLGQVGYFLEEEKNWALDMEKKFILFFWTNELERALTENQTEFDVKVIVVINPGNPTGQVLTRENIEAIIRFAYSNKLFIFADEVYQENVYAEGAYFHSFRKVMKEMGDPFDKLELASFYSCSKWLTLGGQVGIRSGGYMGECGLRGGYVQFENFDPQVFVHFKKMISAKLCSTVLGQIAMDCIVDHPQPGDPSFDLWLKEKNEVLSSLNKRAKLVTQSYNKIEGVHCQEVQGAMYAFPKISLPEKAIKEALSRGEVPDFFYAKKLLEETGICIVPGSGFGQRPNTWHFRTTILPQIELFNEMLVRFKAFHERFLESYK
ncbi:Aminotran_1_2 domain-containing protein [Meloidogyne graminicola]|uniref:alanine transaminase n=1 Tax=Meloidogyne graminicola TaxID=189291 RepID=A0A8S9ZNC2_9BILA|nr:Aminotran_1_2 domain-containing protein [Meloidogyne graminicola]